ncbi:MAG: redoxin domain-containing protein [Chloracidobacterium sp.]|nr:redoxin domain-containing protein [Chloracidobacterium sp.]MDW8217066.1 redoxin domain-containing protein [Acidobacteriota bacterium]
MPLPTKRILTGFVSASLLALGPLQAGFAEMDDQEKIPVVIQKAQKQGDPVEFLLPTPDGTTLDAEKLRGKVVLLCFAAHGSSLMRPLLRQINNLADAYSQVTICLILTNGRQPRDRDFLSDADLKAWRDQQQIAYPLARDPHGTILFQRLNLSVLPSFVLLRKDGTVALKREGIDPTTSLVDSLRADLRDAIQSE